MYTLYVQVVSVIKFHPVSLYDQSIWSYTGHFETNAPNDPKMSLEHCKTKTPYMCY